MALTTLPYPSLDFVPLDILTAEEMNQIVANYTAINNATIGTNQLANSSITTPKLANKAVTSDKVDFTTLTYFAQNSSDVAIGTGETTVITINNLQHGTYLVFGVLSLNKTSSEGGDVFTGLKYDGKSERICQISMSSSYGWVYPPAVGMAKITLTGNSVQLFAQRPSVISSMQAMKNGSLLLIKIG